VVRERENDMNVLMGGEGRRQSIRIESATEGNVGSGDRFDTGGGGTLEIVWL
jgi:hypothetical protein